MDLGIRGKWAVVCAASKGLGYSCAQALADEGVNIVINARGAVDLQAATQRLKQRNPEVEVISVIGDITDPSIRQSLVDAAPQVDILINNAGGPKPGNFREWTGDEWRSAIDTNMLAPIELIKLVIDAMASRGFGRIINITSGAVKSPLDALGLSTSVRCGLTGFVAGLARQKDFAAKNTTINNILPGAFKTQRLEHTLQATAERSGKTFDAVAGSRLASIPMGRFGDPAEFAALCAFLCSHQAAYMTGQNLLVDGGAYPGIF
ncbi:SDR family oxidoreductase [Pseudomonas sp. Root569]|uniref:SDR family oxidoreductase n=1 Tax=Pseudomonas sp. Root569 TaxID=1736566 RepID=UPI0007032CCC|nr:SDR family oxidoreductase [Pseudomonas sp. Root569]KRA07261.1 3-oxoacyl-ACP reductase [Pseudomonas sp. Root569]